MKHYIGNCINSFDDDGDCILGELPFVTTSDFACALEDASPITESMFMEQVEWSNYGEMGNNVELMSYNELVVLYEVDQDVHYFFI